MSSSPDLHREPTRRQNRRGQGDRLQDEILAAAGSLLERGAGDDALTLRAIARQAGITAPAIYAHFADREEILRTVVIRTFGELAATLVAQADRENGPRQRLFAVCRAYLDFAAGRPHHYRVLFERHRVAAEQVDQPPGRPDVGSMVGADAFGVLLEAVRACIEAGASSATSPEAAATRIWIGLHGQATLRASLPWFPWPARDALLEDLIVRLGDLRMPR